VCTLTPLQVRKHMYIHTYEFTPVQGIHTYEFTPINTCVYIYTSSGLLNSSRVYKNTIKRGIIHAGHPWFDTTVPWENMGVPRGYFQLINHKTRDYPRGTPMFSHGTVVSNQGCPAWTIPRFMVFLYTREELSRPEEV